MTFTSLSEEQKGTCYEKIIFLIAHMLQIFVKKVVKSSNLILCSVFLLQGIATVRIQQKLKIPEIRYLLKPKIKLIDKSKFVPF